MIQRALTYINSRSLLNTNAQQARDFTLLEISAFAADKLRSDVNLKFAKKAIEAKFCEESVG